VTVSFDYESARDDRGEDAIMRLDGDALTLQITVPPAEVFWREASKGSAREQIEHAARWLGSAVVRKAEQIVEPAQRAKTVLAIDAQHVGVLATLPVIEAYLDEFGDPASELGFSSVWVVGPTTSYCLRIGQGIP
jgi:hypothetical protein